MRSNIIITVNIIVTKIIQVTRHPETERQSFNVLNTVNEVLLLIFHIINNPLMQGDI